MFFLAISLMIRLNDFTLVAHITMDVAAKEEGVKYNIQKGEGCDVVSKVLNHS
jgi:hypothetical protein